jgi:hypothetical protein
VSEELFNDQEPIEVDGMVEIQDGDEPLALEIRITKEGEIYENLEAIKSDLVAQVRDAIVKIASGEATPKKVQAYANKLVEDLDKKRIAVKKAWMQPYDKLDKRCKDIKEEINSIIEPVKQAIAQAEQDRIEKRKVAIGEIVDERLAKEKLAIEGFLRKCSWLTNEKWLNASVSEATIAKDFDKMVTQAVAEITELDLVADGAISAAVADNYQRYGNMASALSYKRQLVQAEAERAEREAARNAVKDTPPVSTPFTPPQSQDEDPVEERSFRVKARHSQLVALAQYMTHNGIKFGSV